MKYEEYQNGNSRQKIRYHLKDLWSHAWEIQNKEIFKEMSLKEKRTFLKIEKQLWELYKLYYNDLLLQESNTTERTIDI